MTPLIRKLEAFPMMHELHTRSYRIWVSASLSASELLLNFKLEATHPEEFVKVDIPEVAAKPARKNELWNETCFECFIPSSQSSAYLEINASPSGNWNFYAFKDYREGMTEFQLSPESKPRQTAISRSDREIECVWIIPLTGIRQGFISVRQNSAEFQSMGFSTVLNTSVAKTYWALSHDGVKPDFHLRSSFIYPIQSG